MPSIVSVKNLTKTYKSGFQALKSVNLEIEQGEILALLGPNGAGKTTLISTICGIVQPSSGTVTVGGRNIPNAEFERLVLEVRDAGERLRLRGVISDHPNHFEILTAVAFLYFRNRAVDIAVLEVGLGGRLDATNVAQPLVSTIVSIDFDHEEFLGRTLSAIARERTLAVGQERLEVEVGVRTRIDLIGFWTEETSPVSAQ